ncbi:MAG: serine/threonine-protein phosphatase [Planctomycetes bacterium]|nr:serine/threonine-protein phosphatase [Planctomycetota bacterium]
MAGTERIQLAGRELFAALAEALGDECLVQVVDADGGLVEDFDRGAQPAGDASLEAGLGASGLRLRARVPSARAASARGLVTAAARAAGEQLRLESEMESVYAGSLQLLEEVAMTAEMLARLPSCGSDHEVVRLALETLIVGASVERAAWITLDHVHRRCLVEVELCASQDSSGVREYAPARGVVFEPEGTIVERAIRAGAAGLVEDRDPAAPPDRPESRARREVLALPVRFGEGADGPPIGVILAIDKRANSYATATRLGSQETKMVANVALMIGSAIGNRRAAEVGQEVAFARAIQQQVLPAGAASVAGFELVGRCATCGAVGGDYFDFVPMADGRTLALVADVSGHNLASGMVMVGARAALRVIAGTTPSPATVFDGLAAAIHDDLARTERFITAAALAVTPDERTVEFVGAGHPDALVLRAADGRVERLVSANCMLGFLRGVTHRAESLRLEAGDLVLLYTDGIVEAADASGELFGEGRLVEVLRAQRGASAAAVLDAVFGAIGRFCGDGVRPADDLTVLVLRSRREGESR